VTDIDIAHPHHNPFDLPRRNKNAGRTFIIAVAVAVLFHVVVGYYVYKAKFKPTYKTY
jgi:cell division protein FtsN